MDSTIYLVTLIGTLLVLAAAFSSLIAFRFGAPLLLLFLGIGLASGTDGLGIEFDNANAAYFISALALAVILFESGFGTPVSMLRQAASPALALATIGVLITTGLFGAAAHFMTQLDWLESLLLGAAVASTDAAAVFFLLRAGNINLRDRLRSTLEIESGTNDPIAIFLTITLVAVIARREAPDVSALSIELAVGFVEHMGIGAVVGLAGGYAVVRLIERFDLDAGLLPIFVLALAMLIFAAAGVLHGSGFLAVYVAGLFIGNSGVRRAYTIKRFHDGLSWLGQIIMFLVLGLYATPSEWLPILPVGILLGLMLAFVARPIAISLCLMPFGFSKTETAFVSWVGLRGAVSLLLALLPIIGGLQDGRLIFNLAFIVVLVSLVVQGWTVGPLARRLNLIVPAKIGPVDKVELELPGSAHHELLTYKIVAGSPVERGQRIPRWARPGLVVRDGRSMKYQDSGRLQAGDNVYIFVSDRYPQLLDRLFATRTEVDPEDEDFFGSFSVDPARPASDLELAYGPSITEAERSLTIGQFMATRLNGRPEYADRVPLAPIELIVRDVDERGKIIGVGVSIEPHREAASVPVFLSFAEMRGRIAGWIKSRRAA
jgi:cell volume regulation protein A